MKAGYYVLFVWNDVEPELYGPFNQGAEQDKKAKALRAEHGEDHGIFALDVTARGQPKVSAYSGGFFAKGGA